MRHLWVRLLAAESKLPFVDIWVVVLQQIHPEDDMSSNYTDVTKSDLPRFGGHQLVLTDACVLDCSHRFTVIAPMLKLNDGSCEGLWKQMQRKIFRMVKR